MNKIMLLIVFILIVGCRPKVTEEPPAFENCAFIQIMQVNNNSNSMLCKISYSYTRPQFPSIFPEGTISNSFIDECPNNVSYEYHYVGDMKIAYYEDVIPMDNVSNCSTLIPEQTKEDD